MKRFRFTLDSVLKYRSNIEEREKRILASIAGLISSEKKRLEEFNRKYFASQTELIEKESLKCLDEHEVILYRTYLKKLSALIKEKKEELEKLRLRFETQKEMVLKAYKNRRILDLLKKKRFQEYCIKVDKEEQKCVDELQLLKFANESKQ